MDELKQRILQDGIIIDNRILKIDNFLNQQIDTTLINHVGQEFARLFQDVPVPVLWPVMPRIQTWINHMLNCFLPNWPRPFL